MSDSVAQLEFQIRKAVPNDCGEIIRLIKELAEYEKMGHRVKITEDVLREDGFGGGIPFFHCFVAEVFEEGSQSKIVGYALYYFTYSTWEGRSSWMEDFYVSPEYRKNGIGTTLWKAVAQDALANGCARLDFAVLDWNQPSIDFYKRRGAINISSSEGWNVFRLSRRAIKNLLANPQ